MNSADIEKLKTYFLSKAGAVINGVLKPDQTDTRNLGAPDKRFLTIYAKEVIADNISGGTGGSGGDGGNADKVDGFHASQDRSANTLLALDVLGVFPREVYHQALLITGERALSGSLVVGGGYTIDEVDLDVHDHSGLPGRGMQVNHIDLLNNDADVHPQYPQIAQDEIIVGNWMFTDLQDRSAGWLFEPALKRFRSVPYNMAFIADVLKAQIQVGANSEILMNVSEGDASLKVGLGDDAVTLSGSDALYRLWVGNADPALAPFSVTRAGYTHSISGKIGGWFIHSDRIEGGNITLLSGGEVQIGSGAANGDGTVDYVGLSAIDGNGWRMWAGNPDPEWAPFKVNRYGQVHLGDARVTGLFQSNNFISGEAGFSIDSVGRAEFNNIIARGRIDTAVFSERKISAVSGTMIVAEAATLKAPILVSDNAITVDTDIFNKNDILYIKGTLVIEAPGGGYQTTSFDEYMKVMSSPISTAADCFTYSVFRDLAGTNKQEYKAGTAVVRMGSSVQGKEMHSLADGEPGGEYGSYLTGGAGGITEGGWLVMEGSRGVGPYFAVARRRGPIYNQFDEVVRIGNLQGLAVLEDGRTDNNPFYGAFVGDAACYWAYDQDKGLRIKTRSGATAIDETGITSDQFSLLTADDVPAFIEDRAAFYLYKPVDKSPMIGVKLMVGGVQVAISRIGDMTMTDFDMDADGLIDFVHHAEHTPWAGLENAPSTFSPSAHRHNAADIDGIVAGGSAEANARSWFGL